MAINNSPDLYMGGATIFNSQPATQFYLQSMAKKRAKDEALDNYYRDFQKSINPAGVRNQDIEGYMQRVNEWRNFYRDNKEQIKNPLLDNGKAQSEFMSRHQDALGYIQQSKNRGDLSAKAVLPILGNPDKRTRFSDKSLENVSLHDLPLDDPNSKELDPTTLDFDAKQFDINAQSKLNRYATQGLKFDELVENVKTDPKTHSKTVTYEYKFNPQAMGVAGQRYADAYDADDSFQTHIDTLADNINEADFDKLNNEFKKTYNRDIISHKDFAAAYGLNKIQQEREVQKSQSYNPFLGMSSSSRNNPANNFNFGVSFTNALRTGNKEGLSQLKNLLGSGNGRIKFNDAFVDNSSGVPLLILQTQEKDPSGFLYNPVTTKIAVDDPSLPDQLTALYQTIMGSDTNQEKQQYPTQREQVVQPRQVQQPPKTQSKPTQKSKSYKVGDRSYTHADLLKLGYTEEQIQQAIKLGTIK